MYKSLKKNEHWALYSGAEGVKMGVLMHLPDWLSGVRLRYQRLAIGWCLGVPLGVPLRLGLRLSQKMADDWRGAFGATQVICYHP